MHRQSVHSPEQVVYPEQVVNEFGQLLLKDTLLLHCNCIRSIHFFASSTVTGSVYTVLQAPTHNLGLFVSLPSLLELFFLSLSPTLVSKAGAGNIRIYHFHAFLSKLARYDHIFTLRMNTCSCLFHDRFCNWYATNTLATTKSLTITVVRLVILFIGTDATDSDKNNEYYASHNDSRTQLEIVHQKYRRNRPCNRWRK